MAKKTGGIFKSGEDADAGNDLEQDYGAEPGTGAERPETYQSFLGAGSSVEGKLVCTGPARIAGSVNGEIVGDHLISIDADADVKADLNVREARIEGRIHGNINATERVSLAASARIDGDIQTPSLMIEQGAEIKGQIDVGKRAASMAKPNPVPAAQKPLAEAGQDAPRRMAAEFDITPGQS